MHSNYEYKIIFIHEESIYLSRVTSKLRRIWKLETKSLRRRMVKIHKIYPRDSSSNVSTYFSLWSSFFSYRTTNSTKFDLDYTFSSPNVFSFVLASPKKKTGSGPLRKWKNIPAIFGVLSPPGSRLIIKCRRFFFTPTCSCSNRKAYIFVIHLIHICNNSYSLS